MSEVVGAVILWVLFVAILLFLILDIADII